MPFVSIKKRTRNVLLLGAGLSTPAFIRTLAEEDSSFRLVVVDRDSRLLKQRASLFPGARALPLDVTCEKKKVQALIRESDYVVSMLPPFMHGEMLEMALSEKKPFFTASYVQAIPDILRKKIEEKCVIPVVMECGLDPGIDHVIIARLFQKIREEGAEKVEKLISGAGALPHPSTLPDDDNPWRYRFTWAPSQVVRAGKKEPVIVVDGQVIRIPYVKVFEEPVPLTVSGLPPMEMYPNGDASAYMNFLTPEPSTFVRASIRFCNFVRPWDVAVKGGLTSSEEREVPGASPSKILSFLISRKMKEDDSFASLFSRWEAHFKWLGIQAEMRDRTGSLKRVKPVEVLEELLREKWQMREGAPDFVILFFEVVYVLGTGERKSKRVTVTSSGKFPDDTAVARGVGLTLAHTIKTFRMHDGEVSPGIHTPYSEWLFPSLFEFLRSHELFAISVRNA